MITRVKKKGGKLPTFSKIMFCFKTKIPRRLICNNRPKCILQKSSNQVTGNIGLYYVCYYLSKLGWNVLPTSRNAKGIDAVIYSQDGKKTHTLQIKALSKNDPVPFGTNLDNMIAEYVVICRKVQEEKPEIFIATEKEIKDNITVSGKGEKLSYWLETKQYEKFTNTWDKLGNGF